MYNIHVFISHSWSYTNHYDRLAEWIFARNSWKYRESPIVFINYSIPKDDPVHTGGSDSTLTTEILNRVKASNVVVIPMGMYAAYSKWIGKEIAASKVCGRPILAVDPWGQERSASIVKESSAKAVGWTKQGVVDGIWELYSRYTPI